jgi:hypothetical protein
MEAAGITFDESGAAHMTNAPDVAVAMLTPERVFNVLPGDGAIMSEINAIGDSMINAMEAG